MSARNKSNQTLVLLHGFCENNSLWDQIIPSLQFEGEVIAPDLPGFGKTNLKTENFSLTNIAATIYDQLKSNKVESCICVGHSLGGYITLALKDAYSEFVSQIGLLHSTSFPDTPEKQHTRDKLIQFLDHHPLSDFLSTFAPSLFAEANKTRLKKEIDVVINMSKGVETKTIQGYARAMRNRKDYSSLLFAENKPLFIAGIDDMAIPLNDSKKQIAKIENKSNCYLLENVAHMGMYENPKQIIDAINQFCSK